MYTETDLPDNSASMSSVFFIRCSFICRLPKFFGFLLCGTDHKEGEEGGIWVGDHRDPARSSAGCMAPLLLLTYVSNDG